VTRLIIDTHDAAAFQALAHLTVGGFRDWLLSDEATPPVLAALPPGATPEMAAAVAKISRLQDLMVTAAKCKSCRDFAIRLGCPVGSRFAFGRIILPMILEESSPALSMAFSRFRRRDDWHQSGD
jgi:ethanolamine ammonia-lyase large subunit